MFEPDNEKKEGKVTHARRATLEQSSAERVTPEF